MIESIDIKNFQSHKHSVLEFDPGVNVIVGSSDSGKTAIIRALRWLIWNRPSGDAIRSWWGGDTEVNLTLPTSTISRSKGKENIYKLDGIEFKAMRTDVPEEIQKEINFTNINLQQQLDRPFLLDDSPGEIAQHFNKVAQLDVIDLGMSNIQRQLREIEQEDKARRLQLKEAVQELKTYAYLDKMEEEIKAVEYLEKEQTSNFQQSEKLKKITRELYQIEEELSTYTHILELEKPISALQDIYKSRKTIASRHFELLKLISTLDIIDQEIVLANDTLNVEKPLNALLPLIQNKNSIQEKQNILKRLVTDIEETVKKIEETKKKMQELENKMPETCPFCGQSMKGAKK